MWVGACVWVRACVYLRVWARTCGYVGVGACLGACVRVRVSFMYVNVFLFWRACVLVWVLVWVRVYGFVCECAGVCV